MLDNLDKAKMNFHRRFFSMDRKIAQIEFNKSIAGCYRDGNAEYDSVGVLLLTWKDDDLDCKEKEVNELENVLKEKFNFNTEQYEIPATDSEESLLSRLKAFGRCYESPSKLGIIYYGGHAQRMETENGVDLEIFARRTAHGIKPSRNNTDLSDFSVSDLPVDSITAPHSSQNMDHNYIVEEVKDQSRISFKAIYKQIKHSEADVLLIVDSCFAAGAFSGQPFSSRKSELFCSIAEGSYARAPDQEGSFTMILINALKEMIQESPEGFSTSDLYRKLYMKQHHAHKPFHFVQSRLDYGRIWLRPCRTKEKIPEELVDSEYMIDVRFHFTKSLDTTDLNRVAKSLQWIPFVQQVKMQNMRGPNDKLAEFIRTVHLAKRLRPIIARIREKSELKRAREFSRTDSSTPSSPSEKPKLPPSSERFHVKKPRDVQLFDWSKAEAITPSDERLTSDEYFNRKKEVRPTFRDFKLAISNCKRNKGTSAAPHSFSRRESQSDAPVKPGKSFALWLLKLCLSQRFKDALFFFAMGVLAPKALRWAVGRSAPSPFAAISAAAPRALNHT